MQETIRLFDEDSRLIQFEACVLSCEADGSLYKIVLNQTAFFPEEGGQTCDRGTLQDQVVEKILEKDRIVYHWVKEPLWEGDTVSGLIDWKKRFSDMQQHSGEHIVSGLIHAHFKLDNVGFHLGSEYVTMDFNGVITEAQLRDIELKANKAVTENLQIQVMWPTAEELEEMDYRSKKALEGPVRIVTVPGYDCCACCAPHVKQTGEIGMIKLVNMEKYKGGVRIYMLCGFRALADFQEKQESVARISALLSAKPNEVVAAVTKQKDEMLSLKATINEMKTSVLLDKINSLPEGVKNICLFAKELDKTNIRIAWTTLTGKYEGLCGCFAGDDDHGYQYVLGSRTLDAKEAGIRFNQTLNGRGGGSKEMFQGNVPATRQAIENYFQKI